MTKLLLDSGDPIEYREIADLAKMQGSQLWGSTTNPSLIAKKIAASGKKLTQKEAFALQKQIVLEIIKIVPGAVSGEVYADRETSAQDMAEQGREIASWYPRVVVKLPTTLEGFKARTILRRENIGINNTLVFSQKQVFAISLHEKIMRLTGIQTSEFPSFISPFIGRLDDKGENGLDMLAHSTELIHKYFQKNLVWMLSASIRNTYHLKKTLDFNCELVTVPAKVFRDWFGLSEDEKQNLTIPTPNLSEIPEWIPTDELVNIKTLDEFMNVIGNGKLDIKHPLTDAGIDKFVADWKTILSS